MPTLALMPAQPRRCVVVVSAPNTHLVPHASKCCGKTATQVVAAVNEQRQQTSGDLGERAEGTKGQMTCRI